VTTVALVEAARDGDRTAFAELYQRYVRMVHGILIARAPRLEVDDLVQDVFLHAMRRMSTLRDPSAFGGWLAAIARNCASDHLRREHPTEPLPDGDELAAAPPRHPDAIAVMRVLRALPDAYRETLAMRLVEGMTGPEIAAATGLTAGSVRVNLHRGMKLLRDRLNGRSARE
jgi:RNA polymerase sigma-70 factor (ECF subfamily)